MRAELQRTRTWLARRARDVARGMLPAESRAGAWVRRRLARRGRAQQGAKPPAQSPRVLIDHVLRDPRSVLVFPSQPEPAISVIVVTYNKVEYTYRCLEGLLAHGDVGYELIVVDNASSDGTGNLLPRLSNATVLRNESNLGFGRACNQAAERARGAHLLLLNNDAVMAPGTLSALLETMEADPLCGAVGGKLVWPNGRLQEAGSVIWSDGAAQGYGRGGDPLQPEFCYERQVDYCSAALLLVRKELFVRLGGFDERFAPAYYEDADLCMAIRQLGYRVMYQPRAVALHQEYASSSADEAGALIRRNHALFRDKWRNELVRHPDRSQLPLVLARDRSNGPRVLVVDDRVPTGDVGSGYPRAFAMIQALARLSCRVTLFPYLDRAPYQPWLQDLEREGVEVMCGDASFQAFASERAGIYDAVLVSRPHNFREVRPLLSRFFPEAPLIYDAEALFFVRDRLKAELQGLPSHDDGKEREELALLGQADLVVTVSEREKRLVASAAPELERRTRVWGHPVQTRPTPRSFEDRKGLLFVGSFFADDSPNEDAVLYFVRHVLPRVRSRLDCVLHVVGYRPPEAVLKCASEAVQVDGYVADLTEHYDACRIFVVPHRYSAGIPLKLCEAMGRGLPAVVSELTAEQLGLEAGREALVGRTPEELADKVVELYRDESLWKQIRESALAFVGSRHDPRTASVALDAIVREALDLRRARSQAS